jgi:hypothetical protein
VGFLLVEYLLEGVAETQYGRGVETLGIDRRAVDEGIVRPEDDGIGIEEEEFIHINWYFSCKITKK